MHWYNPKTRSVEDVPTPFTDEEATAREYAEIEVYENGGPIANADYTLVNDATPENLLTQLDKILQETNFLTQE
jgi:dephospho-CoA kinase